MAIFLRKEDEMTRIYKYEGMTIDLIIILYDSPDENDFRYEQGCKHVCKNEKGENTFVDVMPNNLYVWGDVDYMNELIKKFD